MLVEFPGFAKLPASLAPWCRQPPGARGPRLRDVGHDPQGGRVRGDRDVGQGAHRRWPHAVRHAGRGAPGGGGHGKAHAGHFVNVHDLIGMSPEPLGIATITKVMPHDFINALGLGFTDSVVVVF